ncbi:uncharacterized protein ACIQIH_000008 [Cyanocitta cristata]
MGSFRRQSLFVAGRNGAEESWFKGTATTAEPRIPSPVTLLILLLLLLVLALGVALAVQSGSCGKTPVTPVAPVAPVLLACPKGWARYHGVCDFLSRDQGTWGQGQARCSELGASLAALKDEEMEFPFPSEGAHIPASGCADGARGCPGATAAASTPRFRSLAMHRVCTWLKINSGVGSAQIHRRISAAGPKLPCNRGCREDLLRAAQAQLCLFPPITGMSFLSRSVCLALTLRVTSVPGLQEMKLQEEEMMWKLMCGCLCWGWEFLAPSTTIPELILFL